jgi:hypothetical protein
MRILILKLLHPNCCCICVNLTNFIALSGFMCSFLFRCSEILYSFFLSKTFPKPLNKNCSPFFLRAVLFFLSNTEYPAPYLRVFDSSLSPSIDRDFCRFRHFVYKSRNRILNKATTAFFYIFWKFLLIILPLDAT